MRKLAAALTGVSKVGLDTSPFIYFVERHPIYLARVREIMRLIDTGAMQGFTSVITVTEVLTLPMRIGDTIVENEYRSILLHGRNFSVIAIDPPLAIAAADLRARYTLRTPDALQIAASVQAGCQAFITNDAGLKRVSDIPILILDELTL